MPSITYSDVKGRRILIVGEVASGKTDLTRKLLTEAAETCYEQITVIDMAPPMVESEGKPIGGPLLREEMDEVRNLWPRNIKTPRLSAREPGELLELAEWNRRVLDKVLIEFKSRPTRILFVNDVSIYLQKGKLETLWDALKIAETLVVNGYMGRRLQEDLGTGVSVRERHMMEELASRMDEVVRL